MIGRGEVVMGDPKVPLWKTLANEMQEQTEHHLVHKWYKTELYQIDYDMIYEEN